MSPTTWRRDDCRPYRESTEKLDGREEKLGRLLMQMPTDVDAGGQ
jgi:hypothetical protein